jgi:hypothetical protein
MATFPCSSPPSTCDQSPNPATPYSSEAQDGPTFIGDAFSPEPPLLNKSFNVYPCEAQVDSQVSQDDADQASERAAVVCTNPCSPLFNNAEQQVSRNCADGTPYFLNIPAGSFTALSQLQADRLAFSYGESKLGSHSICMGSLTASMMCQGKFFSGEIVVTSSDQPVTFELSQGTLPPGISMVPESGALFLSGTPTTLGTYVFTIKATSAFGVFTQKTFILLVTAITTAAALPVATFGIAYSQQLNVYNPGNLAVQWSIISGQLPAGLTLNPSTGIISGSSTNSGNFTFTVQATLDGGSCTAQFTMTALTINFNLLVWTLVKNLAGAGGSASGIYSGNSWNVSSQGLGLNQSYSEAYGEMHYTGPAVNCRLSVTTSAGPTSHMGGFVAVNGVNVVLVNTGDIGAPGTYHFDFMIPASVNAVIGVAGVNTIGDDPARMFVNSFDGNLGSWQGSLNQI